MDKHAYWNRRHETMPREQLAQLQLGKLRELVRWALDAGGIQAAALNRAGVDPATLTSPADVFRIPFLTREEWIAAQVSDPPFGQLLAAPPTAAIRHHLTSGTSGHTPLRVLDGLKDWDWIAEMWCYALWGFGVRPADRVFMAFGYGSFVGFWGAHSACEKIGAMVLPGGSLSTEARLRQILDLDATVLCSTPTYTLRLAQEARRLGLAPDATSISRIVLSGEPAGSIPATKRFIEDTWGAKTADTAGMTELGTIMMFECAAGRAHIIEDNFLEEVVDPVSGEQVGYGVQGERVVTSFGRGLIPLLRYRTRDLVVRVPGGSCGCGRTWDVYEGGIRGRVDDMKLVRGTNVYPRAVEAIVREFRAVDEFQLYLHTVDEIRDEIELLVEVPDPTVDTARLCTDLCWALSQATEGLRFAVRVVPVGSLPRFELKARRVKDVRTVIGDSTRIREEV